MNLPDLRGFELESQIYSTPSRLVVIWFSRIDRDAGRWRQIQVTLVGATLSMANLEIVHSFPPLRSCEISDKPTAQGGRKELAIYFDRGEISFECEDIAYSEYSRKIRTLPGA